MWVRGKDYRIRRLMYEIDYVFDEMSLFHIEELFNILVLSNPPHSSSTSSEITTEVREFTVEFNPDNIFIATSLFCLQ